MRPADDLVPKPTFDAGGASIYPWNYVEPNTIKKRKDKGEAIDVVLRPSSSSNSNSGIASLRQICAQTLARNAEAITSEFLNEGSWSCWKSVWEEILALGKDLPEVFRMFGSAFLEQPSFVCHSRSVNSSQELDKRSSTLDTCLIPIHRRHRMENVFCNISVPDFVFYVNTFSEPAVLVDTSGIPAFSTSQLLSLCNIQSLVGLDLSGNSIDDQFLFTLALLLTEKRSTLKILKITSCPNISKRGLLDFLESASLPVSYIEADVDLTSDRSTFAERLLSDSSTTDPIPVAGTKWKKLYGEDPVHGHLSKYSLAMKMHYLLRNTDLVQSPKLVWDFMFFADEFVKSDSSTKTSKSWSERFKRSNSKPFNHQIYMRDPNMKVVPRNVKPPKAQDPLVLFPRAGMEGRPSAFASRKKPKSTFTSANSFFGM